MIEELVRIGPISISPFGLSMVLAFLAAHWQLGRGMRRRGLGPHHRFPVDRPSRQLPQSIFRLHMSGLRMTGDR